VRASDRETDHETQKESVMTTLRKVLVVDDDPVVTKSFDRVLSTKGYAVVTARNGEEALKKIAAEDYDVVYTDIRMPGMNGIEVAEHIKGRRPWLPVVIVTGYGTAENEARAKAAGVRTVLHKPLSPALIESSAQEALAEQRVRETVALLEPAAAPAAEPAVRRGGWKTVAMALSAPFIALAFVLAFPFIGLAALAKYAVQAVFERRGRIAGFMKDVTLFFAGPVVGLLYAALFPLIGLSVLAWTGLKALGIDGNAVKAALKSAGMVLGAPLLGLLYAIALPFVALALLCWIGGKHLFTSR
jgi:CheY-like chemotaxis protein